MRTLDEKIEYVRLLCECDETYRQMLKECTLLEDKADAILGKLSDEDSGAVWDFIMLCEDMSQRALEIACSHEL